MREWRSGNTNQNVVFASGGPRGPALMTVMEATRQNQVLFAGRGESYVEKALFLRRRRQYRVGGVSFPLGIIKIQKTELPISVTGT